MISEWIRIGVQKNKHFANPAHKGTLEQLYPIIVKEFGVPEEIEIISCVRTYKIIMPDGHNMKIYLNHPLTVQLQDKLYSAGIRVPKTIKIIDDKWKVDEWINGECMRRYLTDEKFFKTIAPKYWYKQGALLGEISNHKHEETPISMGDVLWNNFTITEKDEVALIDCKKLRFDVFPERWIYANVLFHKYYLPEQVNAFTEGYISRLRTKRDRLDMIGVVKEFSEKIYEKLAKL